MPLLWDKYGKVNPTALVKQHRRVSKKGKEHTVKEHNRRYGLRIHGADIYFPTRKERDKVTRKLRGKVTYSTFHEEIK